MTFRRGQQVMCIADYSRGSVYHPSWVSTIPVDKGNYPKPHEELVVDDVCSHVGMVGWISFAQYGFGGRPIYWDPNNFVPLAPLEEEIASLMESTIEEPA